jgi:hypothetical protein
MISQAYQNLRHEPCRYVMISGSKLFLQNANLTYCLKSLRIPEIFAFCKNFLGYVMISGSKHFCILQISAEIGKFAKLALQVLNYVMISGIKHFGKLKTCRKLAAKNCKFPASFLQVLQNANRLLFEFIAQFKTCSASRPF